MIPDAASGGTRMNTEELLAEHREDQSLSRFACSCGWTWPGDFRDGYRPWLTHVADSIMPAIRESLAQEIEARCYPAEYPDFDGGFVSGLEVAAEIVRGGAK